MKEHWEAARLGLLLVGLLLVAGCVPAHEADPAAEADTGLGAEFVGWLFPVDAGEYEAGSDVFVSPFHRRQTLELASCLESTGYRDLGEALRLDPPARIGGFGAFLFPAPPELDAGTIEASIADMPARALFSHVNPGGGTIDEELAAEARRLGIEGLAHTLEQFPRFGVPSSDAASLYDAMVECEERSILAIPDSVQHAIGLGDEWLRTLGAIDTDPGVADALDAASGCLRDVDPQFASVVTPVDWSVTWEAIASETPPADTVRWQALRSWLDDYYRCMVPVIEARRPLRLAARDDAVDRQLPQLLELQVELREALEGIEQ